MYTYFTTSDGMKNVHTFTIVTDTVLIVKCKNTIC